MKEQLMPGNQDYWRLDNIINSFDYKGDDLDVEKYQKNLSDGTVLNARRDGEGVIRLRCLKDNKYRTIEFHVDQDGLRHVRVGNTITRILGITVDVDQFSLDTINIGRKYTDPTITKRFQNQVKPLTDWVQEMIEANRYAPPVDIVTHDFGIWNI